MINSDKILEKYSKVFYSTVKNELIIKLQSSHKRMMKIKFEYGRI